MDHKMEKNAENLHIFMGLKFRVANSNIFEGHLSQGKVHGIKDWILAYVFFNQDFLNINSV